jgi:hypothetical protein
MKRKFALIASALTLAMAGAALAQPSLYYVWKNKDTGKTMCEPQADEATWTKVSGPYSDPNCSLPEKE